MLQFESVADRLQSAGSDPCKSRRLEWRVQNLIALLVGVVAASQTVPPGARLTRTDPVLVRAVLDGDTIDVERFGRVRLLGIDAPEIGRGFDTPAPFGLEARQRLAALVLHRWVRLEQEGPAIDAYNRHLAYVVREDGLFVNAAIVRDGLARISARIPLLRLDELRRAELEAQASRRGMWGAAPAVPLSGLSGYTRRSQNKHRGRPSRVRIPKKNSRKKQALLPVQPLADLDLCVLHRAGPAHLRSV